MRPFSLRLSGWAAAVLAAALHSVALAASVTTFSPQGEVARVRQVRATFSEAMVPLGDAKAAAPFEVQCAEPGAGRWVDDKTWVYELERDAPPGVACGFTLRSGLKTVAGAAVKGGPRYAFQTGGPAVVQAIPSDGAEQIDEEQVFVLSLSGPATPESVARHAYCSVAGVADRVPVTFVQGQARQAILDATVGRRGLWRRAGAAPDVARQAAERKALEDRTLTVKCQLRLPAQTAVTLVWGAGIATANGVATSKEQRFAYQTRAPFTASLSCERENANAPCLPIRPVRVVFSSPVSRTAAAAVRLRVGERALKPFFDKGDKANTVTDVSFVPPLPERAEFGIELPPKLTDDSGRPLANAALFPLKSRTGDYPPLAKFASGGFGILEWKADPAVPITLRRIEAGQGAAAGAVSTLRVDEPAGILAWVGRLNAIERTDGPGEQDSRGRSLLAGQAGVRSVPLPAPKTVQDGAWPFEVIGLPMKDPGFYVMELQSARLGEALLANRAPMFVRTAVLVTNLAVHFKRGRENSLVWVTTLDGAKPVPHAAVTLLDCRNQLRWGGKTNAQGIAYVPHRLDDPDCSDVPENPPFAVVARSTDEQGRVDMAFAFSNWNNGIEAWRFNLPQDASAESTLRAHTVFDRTLLRAGETVSMKHLVRRETLRGFALVPPAELPKTMRIRHLGSEQEFTLPLAWPSPRGSAAQWKIPAEAKLGEYEVTLEMPGRHGPRPISTGHFRVEEFRLPVLTGRIVPPKAAAVNPRELPLQVQMEYVAGGPASGLPVRVTGMTRRRWVNLADYESFAFNFHEEEQSEEGASHDDEERRIVADKLPLTLDKNGAGRIVIGSLGRVTRPLDLVAEASFADPNGEIQTVSQTIALWPAGLMVGLKVDGWVSVQKKLDAQAVVLDLNGKPLANQPVEVVARLKDVTSHRRRLVGGFYAYENKTDAKDLGTVCRGTSDARGLVFCAIELDQPGNVELVARASDGQGNTARSSGSVWVTQRGELWFEGENQDRMDVLPEKKSYQPGEVARLQVRMPFRQATALVAVEREGIVETQLVRLSGRDPTVRIPIKPEFGPNVYVSVLAIRERLREVPWYSLFVWGWKSPVDWWQAFKEWRAVGKPTALVDLGKPAFKLGIAELRVGTAAHELKVHVTPDKTTYPIRGTAKVRVQVFQPDGRPVPGGTQLALAAVDQALLELQPNASWNLLEAMLQRRSYGVETATAQMQVVGKRHFGRKAAPAGGGGGKAPTRELFDTLLAWHPALATDATGSVAVDVPLNDAITSFRIVAVADAATGLFGTGGATIRATQDLQIISGLPPVVRDGDRYQAGFTLRNNTAAPMEVTVQASATGMPGLAEQRVALPANEARPVVWEAVAPALEAVPDGRIAWELKARAAKAGDAIKLQQKLAAAVPVRVQQATLLRVEPGLSLPVAPAADGLPGKSALDIGLQASLAAPLPGVQRYFEEYPFICLEQKVSKAIGLRDAALWKQITAQLPLYLDRDGLALYFPPREVADVQGSDVLTAYVLAAAHESGFALPDEARARMESGLIAFAEGRIARRTWSPQRDLDARKLAAIEALSRSGKATPRLLQSIAIQPNQWPTSAVIDWLAILRRVPGVPQADQQMREAEQILRARLDYQGTRMGFSTEKLDYWWWLMVSPDANAARLLLTAMDDPAWKDDLPRMLNGLLQRMQRGAWSTTTANVWGSLAVEKFGKRFEKEKVAGHTRITLEGRQVKSFDWKPPVTAMRDRLPLAAAAKLGAEQDGSGAPWLTVRSLAAIPLKAPVAAGFRVTRSVTPVEQKEKGVYSRGDILRVRVEVEAQADMSWVVLSDPVPGGASVLGTGLGRDSQIATTGEKTGTGSDDWTTQLAFEERSQEAYRAYYAYVGKGRFSTEYTLRLNNPGEFALPPTRVEAMYAPEMFAESPNAPVAVKP
jgi:uncharacterized protein YfaS (alpha-2-macroglobulin family)